MFGESPHHHHKALSLLYKSCIDLYIHPHTPQTSGSPSCVPFRTFPVFTQENLALCLCDDTALSRPYRLDIRFSRQLVSSLVNKQTAGTEPASYLLTTITIFTCLTGLTRQGRQSFVRGEPNSTPPLFSVFPSRDDTATDFNKPRLFKIGRAHV